jgi:DNA (cytosine-5)-methyltransferase 1
VESDDLSAAEVGRRAMNVLDLFSGIGGFSLGLERTGGFRTVAFCEREPYCRAVLARHWPAIPIYDDVRTLTAQRLIADVWHRIDVVCGGFPCQPFSTASRGNKTAIDLWPEMDRIVTDIKSRFVIAENVCEAPIANASRDLAKRGYSTHYRCISANDAGADHQRNRWWLIAHTDRKSELHRQLDAEVAELPTLCRNLWGAENYREAVRIPDGLSLGMDGSAIKAIGNAVVPQIPEIIGRAIMRATG